MNFWLEIDMDSDAFKTEPNAELARLLRNVAHQLEADCYKSGSVNDSNHKYVGEWSIQD